jgi:hypothetical protein
MSTPKRQVGKGQDGLWAALGKASVRQSSKPHKATGKQRDTLLCIVEMLRLRLSMTIWICATLSFIGLCKGKKRLANLTGNGA